MQKNLTELVFILDKSGSMYESTADTIGGFNSMIADQKQQEGKALVSTILFSSTSQVLHDRKNLEEIEDLTERDYVACGNTALYDAVGGAIQHIKNVHKYAREEDCPEKTMFVITTDGLENASKQYTRQQVQSMITEQKEKGWQFVFVAANIDAVSTGASIGISEDYCAQYNVGDELAMYCAVSEVVSEFRDAGSIVRRRRRSVHAPNDDTNNN